MIRGLTAFALATLIACLGPLGFPSAADAQQPPSPRHIGVLLVGWQPQSVEAQAFRLGLRDAGYAEGRDVMIDWESAEGDYSRVPTLAAELVQRQVDVIVVDSTRAAQATKRATSTIPIVMALVADPVGSGLVTGLAHPGGNLTGLSLMGVDLTAKRLQLLKEAIPRLTQVAVLWNPDTPYHAKVIQDLKVVAPALSIKLKLVAVRGPDDFSSAFLTVKRAQAQALYVIEDPIYAFRSHRESLVALASKRRLPTVYGLRQFADEGGFISYGADIGDMFRRSAQYVDRILRGANPGDLPIEQPTKFELVVNLKTGKALGITVPESILLRADEVIR